MKNVLLTTTALVAFAGAAAAEMSFSGSTDIGYNDEINGGLFADTEFNLNGSVDLGDGFAATFTYGFDVDTSDDTDSGLLWDEYPTIEITSPFGSLKGGDLDDKGASEYFYADRDGMALDVENSDTSDRFDLRALVEFGDFGLAVGGVDDGAGDLDGLSVGAGATFGNFTLGFGYDEADGGLESRDALDVPNGNTNEVMAVSLDTTFGDASIGLSYIDDSVETSVGVAVGYDVSADLSLGAYYASNEVAANGDAYGVWASYAMGALGVEAYYDATEDGPDEIYLDVSYEIMAGLTGYAGVYDDGMAADPFFYIGGVYEINDNLSATVSYADADEISGPEFKNGTTVMLTASF